MKKLMFIAALLCAGMATQAAVVDWSVKYENKVSAWGDSAPAAGSIVYAFLATDASAVQTALAGKDSTTVAANIAALSVPKGSGLTKGPYGIVSGNISDDGKIADNTPYSVFLVAFNAATIADSTEYLISANQSGNAYTAMTPDNRQVAAWSGTAPVSGTWTTIGGAGVPEPTSGLLLCLGAAMLALRRRRA